MNLHRTLRPFAAAAMLALAAHAPAAFAATTAASPGPQVAWLMAANDTDVDRAFAQGRAENKPVLLYWGAVWCPPCNQLKATLFNRQDFIERSKHFVPVYVDGDGVGAQKLGSRFQVRGYPTMLLFNPQGQEITRLPGEVDAPQALKVLQLGMAGGRPVKAVLAAAMAGKPVTASEWRMLAYYSWDTDQGQLVSEADRPGLLVQLSAKCPATEKESATRLLLKALAGSDEGKGVSPDAALRQRVLDLLADPQATRAHMDVLVNSPREIALLLAPVAATERARWLTTYDAALQGLQRDVSLSRADRVTALLGRVELARLDQPKKAVHPKIPPTLQQQVREQAARDDREISNGYERQAVITTVAYLQGRAGLWKDSDALLQANLTKSHAPYYLMADLGENARLQGRKAEAITWYAKAYARSEGPATRLQWGANYLAALVELAPQDEKPIEQAASQMLKDAAGQQAAFVQRSNRSLQKLGAKLAEWNGKGQHQAVIERLRAQLAPVCAQLQVGDAQRSSCEGLIKS
ncbi:MAG: thioredoxin family protein [Vitreoscilla sp.]|nr:thioredoxin family protein [Vitreoscilla sp.]